MKQAVLSRAIYVYSWIGLWIEALAVYLTSSLHITISGDMDYLISFMVFLLPLISMGVACTGHLKFIMAHERGNTLFLLNLGAMLVNTIALITFMHSFELVDINTSKSTFYLIVTVTILVFSHLILMRPVYKGIERALSTPLTVPYYIFLASYMMLPFASDNMLLLSVFFLLQFIGHTVLYERYKEAHVSLNIQTD